MPGQLGSTHLLLQPDGTVANRHQYGAYGAPISSTETISNPFPYAGGYQDKESGLYYLQARYYDPSTQQFLTRDPLLALTGQAYTYVGGSPLNGTDPGGLDPGGPSGYSDPPVPGFLCLSFGWFCSPAEQAAADFYSWRRQAEVNLIWVNQRYHIVQGTDSLVTSAQVAQLGSTACSLSPGPELPPHVIASENGVQIEQYYRSGDHGPPHLHVTGGGPEVRIGQNGKPLDGDPELTPKQSRVVRNNLKAIRKAVGKIGQWYDWSQQGDR